MKIVTISLGGGPDERPDREGWAIVSYSDPRGGRTSVGAPIRRPRWEEVTEKGPQERQGPFPTWAEIARSLDTNMHAQPSWPQFLKSNVSGNVVRISCPPELDPTVFSAEFNPRLDQQGPHQLSPDFVRVSEERFA